MLPKLDKFTAGQPLDSTTLLEDTPLQFIPLPVLQLGVYKPFYIGYRCSFHAIRCVLSNTETVPTVQRLRQELALGARSGKYERTSVEYFLERGGSIKYALDMVVHLAACLSRTPFGDGSFDDKWDEALPYGETAENRPRPAIASPVIPASPLSIATVDQTTKRRRRSSSFKEILNQFGKKERKDWLVEIQEDEERERRRKLKEEWDASGSPGCALDDRFVEVRYLMGLHSTARWDIDGQDAPAKREGCQLRRV